MLKIQNIIVINQIRNAIQIEEKLKKYRDRKSKVTIEDKIGKGGRTIEITIIYSRGSQTVVYVPLVVHCVVSGGTQTKRQTHIHMVGVCAK